MLPWQGQALVAIALSCLEFLSSVRSVQDQLLVFALQFEPSPHSLPILESSASLLSHQATQLGIARRRDQVKYEATLSRRSLYGLQPLLLAFSVGCSHASPAQ